MLLSNIQPSEVGEVVPQGAFVILEDGLIGQTQIVADDFCRGLLLDFAYLAPQHIKYYNPSLMKQARREDDPNEHLLGEPYDRYQVLEVIGCGTFGKVYLVRDQQTQELFAMKHVLQNKKYKNRELEILQQIHHENIVRLHHSFFMEEKQGTFLNLIMEYVPDTLAKAIKNHLACKTFLEKSTVRAYAKALLSALQYLHKNNICHRDIKPSNILITEDTAKLCDFGSAKILAAGQKNIAYICSRYYRAPELLFGATFYTHQVDIWSVGCVIAEMMTNRSLFEGSNSTSMLLKIIRTIGGPSQTDLIGMQLDPAEIDIVEAEGNGVAHRIRKLNPNCDESLLQLVQQMIVYNPQQRITAEAALQSPLFS